MATIVHALARQNAKLPLQKKKPTKLQPTFKQQNMQQLQKRKPAPQHW
jgi:hypothetical protein